MAGAQGFSVLWGKVAILDLAAIVDHISLQSPGRAEECLGRLEKAVSRLASLPERGRIVPELKDQNVIIYRELVCSPWRIIYRISGRRVWVLAVFDGRRSLEDLLLQRFLH
ncbi:MAG: type II toxin-antitoxin system RelE/ParE family toxin [Elusimicrobia bacterium]|nr:type II toxin-antitoxin system RelE/ParE family toxin [Elusimicrobiota bacterium]